MSSSSASGTVTAVMIDKPVRLRWYVFLISGVRMLNADRSNSTTSDSPIRTANAEGGADGHRCVVLPISLVGQQTRHQDPPALGDAAQVLVPQRVDDATQAFGQEHQQQQDAEPADDQRPPGRQEELRAADVDGAE